MAKFKKAGILLYVSPGNHEKTSLISNKSYLSIYKGKAGLKLFEDEGYEIIDGVVFCFLPYFLEGVEYLTRLANLIDEVKDFKQKKVLFTHIAVDSIRNNDGSKVENDVKKEYFEIFDKVFVAHYHSYCELSSKIIYNSSTHQQNYGDDSKKGFTVLYDDLSFEHVRSKFPKFIHIKIPIEQKDEIQETI